MTNSQQYQTLPTAILNAAEQGDRWLQASELKAFSNFFQSGEKRLAVAKVLTDRSDEIVAAAGDRIFYGGSAMAYLERPPNRVHLPGYTPFPKRSDARSKERLKLEVPKTGDALRRAREFLRTQLSQDRDPVPDGFRRINIRRYGEVRMKRSMRDLSWFLRYITYAIAAGDCSILTANVEGLRGVIPEDVTEATIVALGEMRWRSLRFSRTMPKRSR
ncbi:MAG: hypothetical protein HC895_23205 [Leptolyngbyaceae cyanobacterium SM1_3_5]|nr:hypothetical protein [Leptolyngbyaceae cyanobacterium SM1_3_5]